VGQCLGTVSGTFGEPVVEAVASMILCWQQNDGEVAEWLKAAVC